MTDARVSQLAVEVLRTNLAVSAQVSQLAVEVLRPNVGRGISAEVGTFTLTGRAASFIYSRTFVTSAGGFNLSGQAAGSVRTYVISPTVGVFVLTGQNAALKLPGKIDGSVGAFSLTGKTAVLKKVITLISSAGGAVLTGQASTAKHPYRILRGSAATFIFTGKAAALARPRNIVDPVSGTMILRRLRTCTPAYGDADAAYNAWAATLGVSATGTDYTVTPSVEGLDFTTFALPVLDGSTYFGLNIPHSGAVGLYMTPPITTVGGSSAYSWGVVSLGRLTLATDRPALTIRGFNNNSALAQYQNTNLKLRSAYNSTTGAYEAIVIMTSAATTSPQYPIRCAYRLAAGYLEAVFTVDPVDLPSSGYFYAGYIIGNESTDIAVDGDVMIVSSTAGTFGLISDDLSALRPYISEAASTGDVLTTKKNLYPVATDAQSIGDLAKAIWSLTVSQSVATTEAATYAFHPSAIIQEVVAMADAQPQKWNFVRTITEPTLLADALRAAFPVSLVDTATLTSAASVVRAVLVLERLRLIDPASVTGNFYLQLVDAIVAQDSLRAFFGGSISETLTATDTIGRAPIFSKTATDTVTLSDSLAQKLIIRVIASDRVNLDDDNVAHWVFSPVLTDSVQIEIGYVEPNGAFTTWAVNTRTGAVTEYQNFEFNSFAQIGHKYLGTSATGLYELDGDDDDGTDVIAHIKSGYAQFGGSKYSSFKAAYLGIRGDGNIILKLDTGDGKSYTYQTVIQDMQSTKVRLGKGLRARYFSFELISTGSDFDLDTIEFIPLVAQRRV